MCMATRTIRTVNRTTPHPESLVVPFDCHATALSHEYRNVSGGRNGVSLQRDIGSVLSLSLRRRAPILLAQEFIIQHNMASVGTDGSAERVFRTYPMVFFEQFQEPFRICSHEFIVPRRGTNTDSDYGRHTRFNTNGVDCGTERTRSHAMPASRPVIPGGVSYGSPSKLSLPPPMYSTFLNSRICAISCPDMTAIKNKVAIF
jgi:hypothetical protein